MKKITTIIVAMLAFSYALAAPNAETMNPFVVSLDSKAVTMYIVGHATTSAASYVVTATSISFITAGGLHAGATGYLFQDANLATLSSFKSYLEAKSTDTVGLEGGIVITIPNGVYSANSLAISSLTITGGKSILGASAAKTEYFAGTGGIYGLQYTMPARTLNRDQQYHITAFTINATYGSGSVQANIYDGPTSTATVLGTYKVAATTVDTQISMPGGYFAGSKETPMTIRVLGTANVTGCYVGVVGYKK
jgi:hypothetical protein